MTLRLRRGTNLERQSITFQEGELVYITDTIELYAGDGTTVGGIKVSNVGSPSSLTQNLNLNGYNIQGSGTISATSFVGDGSGLTGIDIGVQSGQEYDINIRGNVRAVDSTLLVDSDTGSFFGTFVGDGSGLTGINTSGVQEGQEYNIDIRGNVKADDSTLLVDANAGAFFGTFVGDGSLISNIAINQLDEVEIFSPQDGDVLAYSNGLWINSSTGGIIQGADYTINIFGSVFSDNSSLVVDGETGSILAEQYTPSTGTVEFSNLLTNNRLEVYFKSQDARPKIYFETTLDGTVLSRNDPDEEWVGLYISCNDDDGTTTSVVFNGGPNHLSVGHSSTGSFSPSVFTYFADGNVGIGIVPTEKFEVNGNGIFSGDVTASAFKGSLMSDDSTTIVDGITGRIFAPSYIQFGAVTRPERDLITPANGMVIYNSTVNRFQGYQGGSWINLDDGTADI
jgi:hypothetical protein